MFFSFPEVFQEVFWGFPMFSQGFSKVSLLARLDFPSKEGFLWTVGKLREQVEMGKVSWWFSKAFFFFFLMCFFFQPVFPFLCFNSCLFSCLKSSMNQKCMNRDIVLYGRGP